MKTRAFFGLAKILSSLHTSFLHAILAGFIAISIASQASAQSKPKLESPVITIHSNASLSPESFLGHGFFIRTAGRKVFLATASHLHPFPSEKIYFSFGGEAVLVGGELHDINRDAAIFEVSEKWSEKHKGQLPTFSMTGSPGQEQLQFLRERFPFAESAGRAILIGSAENAQIWALVDPLLWKSVSSLSVPVAEVMSGSRWEKGLRLPEFRRTILGHTWTSRAQIKPGMSGSPIVRESFSSPMLTLLAVTSQYERQGISSHFTDVGVFLKLMKAYQEGKRGSVNPGTSWRKVGQMLSRQYEGGTFESMALHDLSGGKLRGDGTALNATQSTDSSAQSSHFVFHGKEVLGFAVKSVEGDLLFAMDANPGSFELVDALEARGFHVEMIEPHHEILGYLERRSLESRKPYGQTWAARFVGGQYFTYFQYNGRESSGADSVVIRHHGGQKPTEEERCAFVPKTLLDQEIGLPYAENCKSFELRLDRWGRVIEANVLVSEKGSRSFKPVVRAREATGRVQNLDLRHLFFIDPQQVFVDPESCGGLVKCLFKAFYDGPVLASTEQLGQSYQWVQLHSR